MTTKAPIRHSISLIQTPRVFHVGEVGRERWGKFAPLSRVAPSELLRNHTTLTGALAYCCFPALGCKHVVRFDVPDYDYANKRVEAMMVNWSVNPPRETWTAFYHMTFLDQGGEGPVLIIACRDPVDAAMFRMQW